MFAQAIALVNSAMFPLLRFTQMDGDQVSLGPTGTAFFINSTGHFITTSHLFDDPPPNSKLTFNGRLPGEVVNPRLDVQEVAKDDTNDIFIGRINVASPNFLNLHPDFTPVGRSVCIAGYPLAKITVTAQGLFDLSQVRRYYQPSFVLDRATTSVSVPKARVHEGYLIRDFGLYGMSGGPVFDTAGTVIGMQGSVTPVRESSNGTATIKVQNAAVISSKLILEFVNKSGVSLK